MLIKEISVLVGAAIGLPLGNFVYQAVASQNWHEAFERSFFQLIAIGGIAILLHFWSN